MRLLQRLAENPFFVMALRREQRQPRAQRLWAAYGAPLLLLLGPLGAVLLATRGLPEIQGLQIAATLTAFLIVLVAAARAACATATAVVGEKQRGTLVTLALTRIDSADYADGIAMAALFPLLRALVVLLPLAVPVGCLAGGDVPGVLMAWSIAVMVSLVFAYFGVQISTTSRTPQEATNRVWSFLLVLLFGSPFLFLFGGFVAYPLWLLHPYAALTLALWGAHDPGPTGTGLLCLRWYALLFIPLYLGLLRTTRRRAIAALERIPLT